MGTKKYGEVFVCLDEFWELLEVVKRDTAFKTESIRNEQQEVVGLVFEHMGNKATILQPDKHELEHKYFQECNNKPVDDLKWNSEEMATKLFMPFELHLPLYVITEVKEDTGYDNEVIDVWLSAHIRAVLEVLAELIGGWTPANNKLVFDKNTWDFDVFIHSYREPLDANLTTFQAQVEARTLNSDLFVQYL